MVDHRHGIPKMLWGLLAYLLWCAIRPRRYAYGNRPADFLLSWTGVWGYRDTSIPWWRQ